MIPYFQIKIIHLGPVPIQVWGLCVALGIAVGTFVAYRQTKRQGLDADMFLDLAAQMLLAAIIGARLFFAVFYDPAPFLRDPAALVRLWDGGLSIYGGFFAAAACAAAFCRRHQLSFWKYADAAAYALPLGCGLGRIGCFLIHDHPGILTNFFLAVDYPGGPRLDHGLLLSLLNFAIFIFFLILNRPAGVRRPYLAIYMTIYGAARFGLDFLRARDLAGSDIRFLGLTPAQYFSALLFAAGLTLLIRQRRRQAAPAIG